MELLYRFFARRRLLLALLTAATAGIALFFTLRLQLIDDLSKIIPLDEQAQRTHAAFRDTKFSETLIFHLYSQDSTATDSLIATADSLVDVLQTRFVPAHIRELRYTISDTAFFSIYKDFYNYLPFFLSDADYARLAHRLASPDSLDLSLRRVYKTLLTPTSFVWKQNALSDPLGLTGTPLQQLRQLQISDAFVLEQNHLFSRDRRHLIFLATPAHSANDITANTPFYQQLDSLLQAFPCAPSVQLDYFSAAAVAVANASQIKSDVIWTVNIAMGLLLLFISLFFRRWYAFPMLFLPVALGALCGLAALSIWSGSIAGISLGFGAVLLGITVDYSLHYLTHARTVAGPEKALRDVQIPMLMSSSTTAAAFFCLRWVSSDALRDLGLFVGVSVLASAFFALLLLPHLAAHNDQQQPGVSRLSLWLESKLAYPFHRHKLLLISVLAFSVLCLFFWDKVGFERDLMRINYMPAHLQQAENQLNTISAQSSSSYCLVQGKTLDEALDHQQQILPKLDSLRRIGRLQRYLAPTAILPSRSQQQAAIERWNRFWSPERRDSLQRNLIERGKAFKFKEAAFEPFYNLLQRRFEPADSDAFQELRQLALNEYITERDSQTTLLLPLFIADGQRDSLFAAFQGEAHSILLDRRHLTNEFIRILRDDFNQLAFWSFVVVFAILLVAFGRIELAVLTFIPVLLGWLWTLGIMGLMGWDLNIIDIIITTFISGLGIDYSIFLARGMLHRYTYGEDVLPSYKTSIFLSALTTLLAIGALIFAQHPALHTIALIAIIGIGSVLLIPYIVLPLLFEIFITRRAEKGLVPYTLSSFLATVVAYGYFLLGCLLLGSLILIFKLLPLPLRWKKRFFHRTLQLFSKSLIYLMFNVKKVWINVDTKTFDKPCVVIANHQSFLDIMLMVSLHPKLVLMTNDWVWNSPFFGQVVKYADFYPVSSGAENSVEALRTLYEQGFSIMIFPEGTRTPDGKLKRFKKGAFYLAEQLGADILPIVLHGTGACIRKHDLLVNSTTVSIEFLPRIAATDPQWGTDYSERSKRVGQYFKEQYARLCRQTETPLFFAQKLQHNYIYKSPVLEWYVRIKTRMEDYYALFHERIPRRAHITDIGCGYGMMAHMLHFLSDERSITALDYDAEKIEVARHCFARSPQVQFFAADAMQFDYAPSDVFLISDMLHYLRPEQQQALLRRCIELLRPGGMLIIRDGDRDLGERHKGTEMTEKWSTGIGFNQMDGKMHYLSGKEIESLAAEYGKTVERIDQTKRTSNIVFVVY